MTEITSCPTKQYRDPKPEELESPKFNAIWKAIKGWDISRESNGLYSGATGTDVCIILDALTSGMGQEPTNADIPESKRSATAGDAKTSHVHDPNDPFCAVHPDLAGKRKLDLRLVDEGGPQLRPIKQATGGERDAATKLAEELFDFVVNRYKIPTIANQRDLEVEELAKRIRATTGGGAESPDSDAQMQHDYAEACESRKIDWDDWELAWTLGAKFRARAESPSTAAKEKQ